MSTNYYANFSLGDTRNDHSITYRLHIGKANWSGQEHGYGISTMNGKHFPDIESWVKFLRHNIWSVTIVDESNEEQDTEEFIQKLLLNPAPTSANQIAWLRDHEGDPLYGSEMTKIWDKPQPFSWEGKHWIDEASGKLFYSGEFS